MDFTHLPNFPSWTNSRPGEEGVQIEIFSGNIWHFFPFVRNSRPGGGANRNFRILKYTFFPFQTLLTTGGGEVFGQFHELHTFIFHGLHNLSFMDSTRSLFELHILLMDCVRTPQIHCFNYTFGFMDSTKVLVSTLRIRPAST